MTNKEIEKELEEIKEILKVLTKGENEPKNATTFGEVKIGEQFIYRDKKFTKLSEDLALIDTIDKKWGYCIFDGENNDYDTSVLREYINTIWLKKVDINLEDFETFDNGDHARPLSLEEWKEYKGYIKKIDDWSWLRSGVGYNAGYAYDLSPSGVDYGTSGVGDSRAVRLSIHFKSNTLISVTISDKGDKE